MATVRNGDLCTVAIYRVTVYYCPKFLRSAHPEIASTDEMSVYCVILLDDAADGDGDDDDDDEAKQRTTLMSC